MPIMALMDRWIHGIGTNRALEQLMDAAGGCNCCRWDNIIPGLWWKLVIVMVAIMPIKVGDLFLLRAIRRRHTLNIINIHFNSKLIDAHDYPQVELQNPILRILKSCCNFELIIPPSFSLHKNTFPLFRPRLKSERERERNRKRDTCERAG